MTRVRDLTGGVFGRLLVIKRVEDLVAPRGIKELRWECLCECGSYTICRGKTLKNGYVKSCGCLRRETVIAKNSTHNKGGTRCYKIWLGMKQRCNNIKTANYLNYGGRGITYDPKWETFEGFWEDMEEGYKEDLTLERVDVNGNYEKGNCTWIPKGRQSRNTRKSKNNSTGKTGVTVIRRSSRLEDYVATWYTLDGRRRTKGFSIKKYGEQEAFRLACEYRDEQIRLLNEQGAGYTEGHGK